MKSNRLAPVGTGKKVCVVEFFPLTKETYDDISGFRSSVVFGMLPGHDPAVRAVRIAGLPGSIPGMDTTKKYRLIIEEI